MTNSYFDFNNNLTPVRVVSTSNIAGLYFNGPALNGVGSSLTISSTTLTIDSVVIKNGDRILLMGQNSTIENGLYNVSIGTNTITLNRTNDFQSVAQMHAGQTIGIGDGTIFAGNIATVIAPLPNYIGRDAINFKIPTLNSLTTKNSFVSGLGLIWGSTTVSISPGSIYDSSLIYLLNVPTQLTVTGSVQGVGGLDTGTIINNRPYALYLIGSSSNPNSTAAIFSLNHTTPALPVGYNIYRRIGRLMTSNVATSFIEFSMAPPLTSSSRFYSLSQVCGLGGASGTGSFVNVSLSNFLATANLGGLAIPITLLVKVDLNTNSDNSAWNIQLRTPGLVTTSYEVGGKYTGTGIVSFFQNVPLMGTSLINASSYGIQVQGSNFGSQVPSYLLYLTGFMDYI